LFYVNEFIETQEHLAEIGKGQLASVGFAGGLVRRSLCRNKRRTVGKLFVGRLPGDGNQVSGANCQRQFGRRIGRDSSGKRFGVISRVGVIQENEGLRSRRRRRSFACARQGVGCVEG